MKRFWTTMLLVALACLVAFHRLNESPPAPKAATLLPEATALLLEFPDFARTRASFPKTVAHALWQEPQVQRLAQDVNRAIMESLGALAAYFAINAPPASVENAVATPLRRRAESNGRGDGAPRLQP